MTDPVTRLKGGDKEAFREIVSLHQSKIRAKIASFGLGATDVDDIAQDVFLYAYENIRKFEPGTRLGAWLGKIAHFKVLRHLDDVRREAQKRDKALQLLLLNRAQALADPGTETYVARLRECLGTLQERHRALVQKRYAGLTPAHLARELDRTVDAVKMLLLRIRRQLRKCVEAGT